MQNRKVKLEDGTVCEITGELGDGGQGVVYKVKNLGDGKTYALKYYKKPMSKPFIDNLRKNILNGSPDESFIWPLALAEPVGPNKDKYGYLMELYGKEYVSYAKVVKGVKSFPTKEMQISALIDIVDSFETLHARGYSYQDLNDGGIVFDCERGKVLICDNDNVAPTNLGIMGKFKYMAPEVAIGMFVPDKYSDRFSLAVLLFMLLTHAHPLDGRLRLQKALTAQFQNKIYGTSPVFIFDPNDASNRPDPVMDKTVLKFWPTIPKFVQDLFVKAFTSGLAKVGKTRAEIEIERQARTSEREWREALNRWLDNMASCPHCKMGIVPDVKDGAIKETVCPHCAKQVKLKAPVLIVKRNGKPVREIVLDDDKQIAKCRISGEKSNEPAATVIRSKKNASVLGLTNHMDYGWKCSQDGAKDRLINPGETVPALNGVNIEFDYTYSGEIKIN